MHDESTRGANICITADLAMAVGKIAAKHADCAIQISWYQENDDETLWFVAALDGTNEAEYAVDDQSGEFNEVEAVR